MVGRYRCRCRSCKCPHLSQLHNCIPRSSAGHALTVTLGEKLRQELGEGGVAQVRRQREWRARGWERPWGAP